MLFVTPATEIIRREDCQIIGRGTKNYIWEQHWLPLPKEKFTKRNPSIYSR